jgi:tripartite-type tricarboxylate transporter receptor subunit TctC
MRFIWACLLCVLAFPALAQDYPNRAIRMIVAFPPGGAVDLTGRLLAKHLQDGLGQSVIVDNKPGAGGIVATEAAAKAKPDGYTIYLTDNAPFSINPFTYKTLPYDASADFVPIGLVAHTTLGIVVSPALVPANNLSEFVAFAKAHPGRVDYASSGTGGFHHLSMELFKATAGLNLNHIPYKGGAPALQDVAGGRVHAMFSSLSTFLPFVKSGKVKVLAVGSAKRSPLAPDVPTVAELGYPGFETRAWFGVVGPRDLPREASERLQRELLKVTQLGLFGEQLAATGLEPFPAMAEEFRRVIRSDVEKYGPLLKSLNLRSD